MNYICILIINKYVNHPFILFIVTFIYIIQCSFVQCFSLKINLINLYIIVYILIYIYIYINLLHMLIMDNNTY